MLQDYDDLDSLPHFVASALTRWHDLPGYPMYFDRRITRLTSQQRVVIAQALEQLDALFGPDFLDENPATVALDSAWRHLLT